MTKKDEDKEPIQIDSKAGKQDVDDIVEVDEKSETDIKKSDVERVDNELKMDVHQICNLLQVNENTRSYVEHKYKDRKMTENEWKTNLKKDGLSF
jgi:hypothetical protein